MKKLSFLFSFFLIIVMSAQKVEGQQEKNTNTSNIEIPADFFSGMFRAADDDFLIAWHGGVKVTSVSSIQGQKKFDGSVKSFVKQLNEGYDRIFQNYFYYNMKDGKKQIVSPDGKVWAARCGLKSSNNINISPVTGKEIKGYSADITSDVWSKNFTFSRSFRDPKTNKLTVLHYRIEAVSIYYYHKKPTSLKGTVKRDDNYKLCGKVLFQRLGPGLGGRGIENTKVENNKFDFQDKLHRGDYKVSFIWPHGSEWITLEKDFVYNPTGQKMQPDFKISVSTGEIEGNVKYKNTGKPVKNYPVKIVPVCTSSGLPEKQTITDQDGKYTFTDVPEGEYLVVVKGAEDRDAFLTGKHAEKIKPKDSEIDVKYDIYAYYNAPGFVKAGVVWRKATIRFPGEGEKPQIFDVMAYQKAGGQGQPEGTDGKPLHLPYSMTMPMIGEQTFYGHPENEYETPEVLYIKSLGAIPAFRLNKKHNALNSCHILSDNGGPAYLELSIELSAGSDGEYPEQFRIYCNNTLAKANLPAFPINFKVITFTQDDIAHFQKFEKVEKTVSNGKATLKVVFKPLLEE